MSRFFIAANWKAHPVPDGALKQDSPYHPDSDIDIAVFPRFLDAEKTIAAGLTTGAQHARPEGNDEVPAIHGVKNVGCQYLICGHSDRRIGLEESDAVVAEQVEKALEEGLIPILCVGETLEEFDAKNAETVIERQLGAVSLTPDVIIAYEPVWAIGTGKNATPEYAEKMHAFIRSHVPDASMRILYGGSVNPGNAEALLRQPNIDGLLIGGASLDPNAFGQIRELAKMVAKEGKEA